MKSFFCQKSSAALFCLPPPYGHNLTISEKTNLLPRLLSEVKKNAQRLTSQQTKQNQFPKDTNFVVDYDYFTSI